MTDFHSFFKCHICKVKKEVWHNGKPTIADFSKGELLKDSDGLGLHVCFACESERMSDYYEAKEKGQRWHDYD